MFSSEIVGLERLILRVPVALKIVCLESHGEGFNAQCAKIIHYSYFLDEINGK